MRGRPRKKLRKIRPSSRIKRTRQHVSRGSYAQRDNTQGNNTQGNNTKGRKRKKACGQPRHRVSLEPTSSTSEETNLLLVEEEASLMEVPPMVALPPEQSYEAGYKRGYYEGGEAKAGQQIPPYYILPGVPLEDLIEAGIRYYAGALLPLLPASHVHTVLMRAMNEHIPVSLVRLGDGELLTLAHGTVISTEEAIERGPFLTYAGVDLPDEEVRDQLAASMQKATMMGIPESRHANFQGLLFPVLHYYGLDVRKLTVTSSTVNYTLNDQGLWLSLLRGRNIVVIGNKAAELSTVLSSYGLQVMGRVDAVHGARDIDRVLQEIQSIPGQLDIALVAAGIAAVILCPRITEELGITAVDFGHLANKLESGEMILK
ncbi:hypothetical protein J2Z69_003185 [Paenibacillus shirakamiensis]|uniref:GT-D fold-like domain-containing protein n=1 Tax=Paenibacillus shirakamiensis TaxID=1265935 RepID=A0ABS4JKB0_9BACL|nr:GT-D fold domain-containing glycosyltransferase [Paenibacillus shirakamiensis]MBP2002128.1 hypothetical protein [Paenibacillus shirakamiensis]